MKRYTRFDLMLAASIIALSVPAVAGAEDAMPPATIVVTATRTQVPLADVPASVSVMSQQQIRDSGAQELDDALRTSPGIDLLGYSSDIQHPTSNSLGKLHTDPDIGVPPWWKPFSLHWTFNYPDH